MSSSFYYNLCAFDCIHVRIDLRHFRFSKSDFSVSTQKCDELISRFLKLRFREIIISSITVNELIKKLSLYRNYHSHVVAIFADIIVETLIVDIALRDKYSKRVFVKAFENEKNDLELYLDTKFLAETTTDRLFELREADSSHINYILSDDVKKMNIHQDQKRDVY